MNFIASSMQTCIFWSTVRFLLRGRSIVVARRASRDIVEGVAHRRILSKASNVVKDNQSSSALATEELDEVVSLKLGGWEQLSDYSGTTKLVKRMRVADLPEAVEHLLAAAVVADAAQMRPTVHLEDWKTLRLELCPRRGKLPAHTMGELVSLTSA